MIKMKLSGALQDILTQKGIDKYQPAYDGESVGLDLYYTGETIDLIPYNMNKLLSTGVHIALPKNHMGLLLERGSIVKTVCKLRAGVIDPGYTGEIFVNLVNLDQVNSFGTSKLQLAFGDKLPVQLVVIPVVTYYEAVDEKEYDKYVNESKRQEGKVGSSN